MQKSFDMADKKGLELVNGDTSHKMCKMVANGSENDKLISVSIEEPDDISDNGAVDQSQFDENPSETSKEIGGGKSEIKVETRSSRSKM